MRIGIDCRTILNPDSGERAGVGQYTYHLVRSLLDMDTKNHYVLFFDYRMAMEGTQEFQRPNVTIKFFPFSSYGKFMPFAYAHMLVSAGLMRQGLDVFHAPANVVPLSYRRPSVVTVHDLAIYKHPEWFPSQIFSTRLLVPQTLRRAKKVISVSEATKRDILELFNLPEKKIVVIPEAADVEAIPLQDAEDDVRDLYQLPNRYVLFVGTIEPRKNIMMLLEAWQRFRLHAKEVAGDVELILVGDLGYNGKDLLRPMSNLQLGARHLGYVPHNHKLKLMQEATAFVYPSLYEGFGLPVVEAMALGTPVITTQTSALPEVAGNAALLVDPIDVDALSDAFHRVLKDNAFAAGLVARGKEQAKNFSWKKTAEQTLNVYEEIAKT